MTNELCVTCGQLTGVEEYDQALWDVYWRVEDGRSHREGLVFTGDWLNEHVIDDEDVAALNHAMEKDMHERGLCVTCGRPDLRGVQPHQIMSEADAREMAEMAAEQRAERLAGC